MVRSGVSILLAAALLVLVKLLLSRRKAKGLRVSLPNDSWLLANTLAFMRHASQGTQDNYLMGTFEEHGKTNRLAVGLRHLSPQLPGLNGVVTMDHMNILHVMKEAQTYIKGSVFQERFRTLLGEGIFNADGHAWTRSRKTAVNLLTKKNVESVFLSNFLSYSRKLVAVVRQNQCQGVFDMQELFFRFTLDAFADISFGEDLQQLTSGQTHPLGLAFDQCQASVFTRFMDASWKLKRLLGLGVEGKIPGQIEELRSFTRRIIEKRKAAGGRQDGGKDLLGLFAQQGLSDDELVDMIINFLLAGRDTTAGALTFTLMELLRGDPQRWKRCGEEAAQVIGDTQVLRLEDVKRLKYCIACAKEGVRLYPSVPWEMRVATRDDVLPSGHEVRAGEDVGLVLIGSSRDPVVWGPDAARFDPRRFLPAEAPAEVQAAEADSTPWPMFFNGPGPRMCLGKDVAIYEIAMVLGMLASSGVALSIAKPPILDRREWNATLRMTDGLHLKAE